MQSNTERKNEANMYYGGDNQQSSIAPPPYPGPPEATAPTPYQQVVHGPTVVHGATIVHHGPTMMPTVVPAIVVGQQMGPTATVYVCKSCNKQIITRVDRNPTIRTHLLALILCLVGCWPFVCLPYCVDSCNNADHYCTNCGAYIGSYIG